MNVGNAINLGVYFSIVAFTALLLYQ